MYFDLFFCVMKRKCLLLRKKSFIELSQKKVIFTYWRDISTFFHLKYHKSIGVIETVGCMAKNLFVKH